MLFSNNEAFLARPQPGFEKCRYVFFPGCQAAAIAPATVKAAYLDLCERLEGGVALVLGCCGAIADWAGRTEMEEQVHEQLENAFARLGDPVVIAGCPSCAKELKAFSACEVLCCSSSAFRRARTRSSVPPPCTTPAARAATSIPRRRSARLPRSSAVSSWTRPGPATARPAAATAA